MKFCDYESAFGHVRLRRAIGAAALTVALIPPLQAAPSTPSPRVSVPAPRVSVPAPRVTAPAARPTPPAVPTPSAPSAPKFAPSAPPAVELLSPATSPFTPWWLFGLPLIQHRGPNECSADAKDCRR
jgi:hypothetical protein